MTNPNAVPNPPASDEGSRHAFTELVIAEDWSTRFSVNAAGLLAATAELDDATDPNEVLRLTELAGAELVRVLGAGALSLFARNVRGERAAFEAEFGL